MSKELAANFLFHIDAFRFTKYGGIKMTIVVPEDQAKKALEMAMVPDAVYEGDFFRQDQVTFGGNSAE